MSSILLLKFLLVLYVGFQSLEVNVVENVTERFACVEIMDTSPLFQEMTITVFTLDGTAQGKVTMLCCSGGGSYIIKL